MIMGIWYVGLTRIVNVYMDECDFVKNLENAV